MKERLLGAAVLVLAAVLIVPMLLDGPDPDETDVTRELKLPASESASARTHVVDLGAATVDDAQDTVPVADGIATLPAVAAPAAVPAPRKESASATSASAPRQAPTQPERPVAAQGWAVQVGSFSSESNARRLAELLKASDYPAFVVRSVVQGRVMYRVRVGPEPDRSGAEALAERLKADRQTTQLVQHP